MKPWPRNPVLYEINTWVWLGELGRTHGRPLDLGSVPAEEWDAIAARGFDAVWLMGVWERSPAGIAISMRNPGLLADFRRALPDFVPGDDVGSPYCVRRYVVDGELGGAEGLAVARRELARRGLRLLLDFVPNHVAPDHPWVETDPGHFVRGTADDRARDPASFVEVGGAVFALGRDPYFPAWPDVLQLDAFQPALRQAVIETLSGIAEQCDGVRCDMAMLVMSQVFERTWGARAGPRPALDYWAEVIPAVRARHPEFRFVAEAYWDLEWELQQQGFDHCYDKKLYDRMEHGDVEGVRLHLRADRAYQQGMVRFIENHDEPRAAAAFPPGKVRAAAVVVLTLPGAKLVHEGQLEGRKVKLPVFLGRRPAEPVDGDLLAFHENLMGQVTRGAFKDGAWAPCETSGWPDNPTCRNVLSWGWAGEGERWLVVANFCAQPSQARVHVPWGDLAGRNWRLADGLAAVTYERSGDEMSGAGLYVDLGPWQCHLFRVSAP
jgi:hypothetical protein